jgi:hypothetical protein
MEYIRFLRECFLIGFHAGGWATDAFGLLWMFVAGAVRWSQKHKTERWEFWEGWAVKAGPVIFGVSLLVTTCLIAPYLKLEEVKNEEKTAVQQPKIIVDTSAQEELQKKYDDLKGMDEKLQSDLVYLKAHSLTDNEVNLPPPPRHLTEDERTKFISVLKGLGKGSIAIRTARSEEAQNYGDELESAFKGAGWEIRQPIFLLITKEGVGTKIAIMDDKEPPEDANKIAKAMVFSGLVKAFPVSSFVLPQLQKDQVELYIGFPEK